jgi:hypothetical protein
MTTAELGLAATNVATLSASTAMKELVYYGPGKPPWEGEAHPPSIRALQSCGSPSTIAEQIFIF